MAPLLAVGFLPWSAGCGGGGGVAPPPAGPSGPTSTPDRAPVVSNVSLTIGTAAGGFGGSVQGSQLTLPVGGGTVQVKMDVTDPEGSVPVVMVKVFNNNTGQQTTVTLPSPTGGSSTYAGNISIEANRGTDGLAVSYLLTAVATDAAQNSTTVQLGTVLVPAATTPPVPPPPSEL